MLKIVIVFRAKRLRVDSLLADSLPSYRNIRWRVELSGGGERFSDINYVIFHIMI